MRQLRCLRSLPVGALALCLLACCCLFAEEAQAAAGDAAAEADVHRSDRLHRRGAAASGDEDFEKLFMVKRMRDRLYRRAGDFDRLMNQLEKLNRDSAGANSDSMIFRLRKRGRD